MAESGWTGEIVGIRHLPNEILFQVVSCLDLDSILNFRRTCRRFYSIASDPLLWTNITWNSNSMSSNLKNLKVALKVSKKYLLNLSLTSFGSPLHFSKILHPIQAYKCLHSISLTNFKCTIGQMKEVLKLPALIELHMYNSKECVIFEAVAASKSQLKILSIPQYCYRFRDWAGAGYIPPDMRVFLTVEGVSAIPSLLHEAKLNYPSLPRVLHEARLGFYRHTLEFVSLSSIPIAQICYNSPSMKPFVNCLPSDNDIFPSSVALIEGSMGSNIFSSAISFPGDIRRVHLDVPTTCITTLHLSRQSNLTSAHLEVIAVACPNLLHLDLRNSGGCLNDLKGLHAIALLCSKLQSLNVDVYDVSINVDRLWQVIVGMHNLTVLTASSDLIHRASDPCDLPTLKAIHVRYDWGSFIDRDFNFFTMMPSLRYFYFKSIPSITVFSGLSNLLHSLTHLTHLYLEKISGNKLTLPPDVCCYRNLEFMYLSCNDFIFPDELAIAISGCEHLKVLALRIYSISGRSINTLFDSLTLLTTFYVHAKSHSFFTSKRFAKAYSRFLLEKAKSQGRNVDVLIMCGENVPILNNIQHHMYFTL